MAGFRPQFAWPALVVLAVTTALTVLTTFGTWYYFQTRLESRLEADLGSVEHVVSDRLATYAQTLRGVRSHMYAERRVDRAEFATYARELDLDRYFPGILGIGFALVVPRSGLAALTKELAKDEAQPFHVWPAGKRDEYAPVVYLEPFDALNRRVYGYDLLSSPERRLALNLARDSGEPALSGNVALMQDARVAHPAPGFLLVLPVYGGDLHEAATLEQRRRALVGFIYSPFRASDFFSRALNGMAADFDIEVFDTASVADLRLYSSGPPGESVGTARMHRETTIDQFGRRWVVRLTPGPFQGFERVIGPLAVFLGGLFLAFVLFRVTDEQARQRVTAERLLTDLRRSQAELEYSNRQTNEILESISEAFLSCDKTGRLLYANRQACAIFGKPLEDLVATPIRDLLPPGAAEAGHPLVDRVLVQGFAAEAEVNTGHGAWLEVHGYPSVSGGAFYIRDITRRKRDELALEESEQRYKSLFLYNPDPVFSLDLEGKFTSFNPVAERLSGYAWQEVIGQTFYGILDPAAVKLTANRFQEVTGGASVAFETVIRSKAGKRFNLLVMGGPVIVGGKIEGVFGVAKDVTEARAAERKLAESEERYRLIVEGSYDGVWDWDMRTGDVYWSDRLLEILGLTRAEWQAHPVTFEELLHPDERRRILQLKEDHFERGAEYRAEMRMRHSSGAYRTCLVRGKAQRDAGGHPVRMAGTVTDITDRKRFESTLAFLADASASLSATLDPADVFRTLTGVGIPFLGDGAAAFLRGPSGEVYVESAHPNARCAADMRRVIEAVVHGIEARGSLNSLGPVLLQPADPRLPRLLRFDDDAAAAWQRLAPRAVLAVPLTRRGQHAGLVAYAALTSKRLYGDADMAVAEELARRAGLAFENAVLYRHTQEAVRARDEFLSVASHELKTPVTSIHLQIQLLLEILHRQGIAGLPGDRLENALQNTDRQVSRLVRLINELLDVSRLTTGNLILERDTVDLSALVEETVGRLRPSSPSRIDFEARGPVVGRWDRLRLEQVVTNLVSNAVKYGQAKPVSVAVTQDAGQAHISVCDQGIGIEASDLDRIFNRFERAVSEKQFGGLGMGLYIVKQIVQAHGGDIHVVSRPGEGSTFIVDLPLSG